MKIFIDFDDVIFNTKEFGEDLKNFYSSCGIGQELIRKYYYSEDKDAIKIFDPEGLFARLEEHEKIDTREIRENFAKHLMNLSKFVFADVIDFLKFVGKENVFLISFGLPDFQNKKITSCKIDEMITGCIVTKSSKAEAIGRVMEKMKISFDEKIVFIDDRASYVQDVKKAFPIATTFLLCRKEGRYCDVKNEYCDFEIHDLKEAQEIISKL